MSGALAHAQAELNAAYAASRISWEQYEAAMNRLTPSIQAATTASLRAQGLAPKAAPRRTPRKHERAAPSTTRAQYARLAAAVYVDPKMTPSAVSLVALVVRWARGRGSCDAFVDQLADEMGVSRRTVQYAQAAAERCGYIRVERVRIGRINDANVYHVMAAALPKPSAMPRRKVKQSRDVTAPPSPIMGVQKTAPHETGDKSPPPLSPQGEMSGAPLVAAPVNTPLPCSTTATRPESRPAGGEVASVVPSRQPPMRGENYGEDSKRHARRRDVPGLRPSAEGENERFRARLLDLSADLGRRLSNSSVRTVREGQHFTDEEDF
jgi:hypothetical protein